MGIKHNKDLNNEIGNFETSDVKEEGEITNEELKGGEITNEELKGGEITNEELKGGEITNEELKLVLTIGEKYKEEGEKMKNEFWLKHGRREFLVLLERYKESEERFVEGLEKEEREVIDRLNEKEKKKFFDEYLLDRIIYSGNVEQEYLENKIKYNKEKYPGIEGFTKRVRDWKYRLQPFMEINLSNNYLGEVGVKILAEEWKYKLQPGMSINLSGNRIGVEGIKILAKEWKNSLFSGMSINLSGNEIGEEGVKILAEEWKDELRQGIEIDLSNNNIGNEGVVLLLKNWNNALKQGMNINLSDNVIWSDGVAKLAHEWKKGVQQGLNTIPWNFDPGMIIDLSDNEIGDEWVEIFINELNDILQPGMSINLCNNKIGDKGADEIMKLDLKEGVFINIDNNEISDEKKKELKKWVQSHKDNGINCEVLTDRYEIIAEEWAKTVIRKML